MFIDKIRKYTNWRTWV